MAMLRSFREMLHEFRRSRSGGILVLFAFGMMTVISFIGFVVDLGNAMSIKGNLTAAADSAALTALAQAQKELAQNIPTATATSDAQIIGRQAFLASAGVKGGLLTQPVSVAVTRSAQTLTATVAFTASSPNMFASILKIAAINLGNSVTATLTMPQYLNFYLLLDVSGSMGIPSTNSEQTRLAAINPDYRTIYPGGCTIACHFTAYQACTDKNGATSWCQGYNLSRTAGTSATPVSFCPQPGQANCIQLRIDAVAYAVQQLMTTATSTQSLPNQFGVGLYPFIRWMEVYQALSTNLAAVSAAAAGLTGLIDNGAGAGTLGSGGTHFENALTSINATISNVGDGASQSAPKPFVFLVTDGAQDNQYQYNNGSWSGSNNATTLDPSNCATLKNRGITVAVLYVPYVPIQNPTTIWNNEDGAANANIPKIPPVLQACATSGFYFTASTPADINTAMQAMFSMAVSSAHLTR